MRPRPRTTRRGFTLLEMVVTIIVIAVLAAFTIPRFAGHEERRFDHVADQVADLLMMYAQRESLARRPIGLWHDTVNHRLLLVTLGVEEESGEQLATWLTDRFVRPVVLPEHVALLDVQADGESVDIARWPLQTTPGENRPAIAIVLEGPSHVVTVALASHALAPVKVRSDDYHDYLGGPVDLDAAGRDREDW